MYNSIPWGQNRGTHSPPPWSQIRGTHSPPPWGQNQGITQVNPKQEDKSTSSKVQSASTSEIQMT